MSDYSAVAPPPNFTQSAAFVAALQRAKQIAAKIKPGSTQNSQDAGAKVKRPLEDSAEPETKKVATSPDPMANVRVPPVATSPDIPQGIQKPVPGITPPNPMAATIGGICNEDIRVPDKMVGLIIGRGGEQITRLQSETGCKIQMAPESGGLPERTCTLTGSREAVNRAKELVLSIVNQRSRSDDIPGAGNNIGSTGPSMGGSTGGPGNLMGHPGMVEIMIPGPKVGLIIGKGGETIKQLQEKSGAKMVVIQDGPSQEQEKPLRITGDPQKVEYAKTLVYELIAEKEMQAFNRGNRNDRHSNFNSDSGGFNHGDGAERRDDGRGNMGRNSGGPRGNGFGGGRPNEYGGWDRRSGPMGDKIEANYNVPTNKCGIIIGKGGETIKQINQQTGAHCELDRRNPGTETEKVFTIRGTPEQVEHAKRIFAEKLGMSGPGGPYGGGQGAMGYNPSWNSGGGYQAWPNQPQGNPNAAPVQVNPQTGQPDYSAQWAEYYRSLGLHREAEMIEQQAKQSKPDHNMQPGNAGAQPNAPAAAPGGPQQQPQPQQQQQAGAQNGGQADYSAQWADYYRSIGKIKEAEVIEAQMKSGKMGMQNSQMAQPQMQPNMQSQPAAAPAAAPNAFPQAYGGYPGMNAGGAPGYYAPTAAAPTQQQPAQPAPSFPAGYQNYQYPQPTSEN